MARYYQQLKGGLAAVLLVASVVLACASQQDAPVSNPELLISTQAEPRLHRRLRGSLGEAAFTVGDEGSARALATLPEILVNVNSTVLNTVNERFLCVNLDWPSQGGCRMPWASWPTCRWYQSSFYFLDLQHPNVANAFRALSPLLIRVGGARQDQIKYLTTCTNGLCVTKQRWDDWNNLLHRTGASCIFGINMMAGVTNITTPWNPSNAYQLMKYTVSMKYDTVMAWAFGNEPLKFSSAMMSASKYGKDLAMFRRVVNNAYANTSMARPKVVAGELWMQTSFFKTFLQTAGSGVAEALSVHAYRMVSKSVLTAMGPMQDRVFNESWLDVPEWSYNHFPPAFRSFAAPGTEIWMTETGGILYGDFNYWDWDHRPTAFSNSFWYLDEMSMAAKQLTVFCRQTLVGGMWGMLDNFKDYTPFADFYAAMAFKALMGRKVLGVTVSQPGLRSYAFCTRGRPNFVTLLHLNVLQTAVMVKPTLGGVAVSRHELYIFTPNGDTFNATTVKVNGVPLLGYSMPAPVVVPTWAIQLPGRSYTFDVVAVPAGFGSACS